MSRGVLFGVCASLTAALVFYAAGSFAAASFDISTWSSGGRTLLAMLWLCTQLVIVLVSEART
jgi:hypothetical protein